MKKIIIIMLSVVLVGCSASKPKQKGQGNIFNKEETLYYYSNLSKSDKALYDDLYNCFINHEEKVLLNTVDKTKVTNLQYSILQDHPEIFYVQSSNIKVTDGKYQVSPEYYFNKTKIKEYQNALEKKRDQIIAPIKDKSPYEKIKYIYDYVINNVVYNEGAYYNQEIISAMLNNESVCSGYTKMFQYLCLAVGIPSTYIQGKPIDVDLGNFDGHSWNMISVFLDHYYIDTTWGDDMSDEKVVDYSYFMMSASDSNRLYQPDNKILETINPNMNYFYQNGYYVDSYSTDKISEIIKNRQNSNNVTIKFKYDIYSSSKDKLLANNTLFNILSRNGITSHSIKYINHDKVGTIYLRW